MNNIFKSLRSPSSHVCKYKFGVLALFFTIFFLACPDPSSIKYVVSFDSNGGDSAITFQEINVGSKVKIPPKPTREAYTFDGWYKEKTLITEFSFTTEVILRDMKLYAKWTPSTYRVSFKTGGGTAIQDEVVKHAALLSKPADPTRANYSFSAWYKDYTFTRAFDFLSETITADITLYAKWDLPSAASYTVIFDAGAGGSTVQTQTVLHGNMLSKPSDPTRANYSFGAWYKDEAFTIPFIFAVETITADITLYAKWSLSSHTVFFKTGDGTLVQDAIVEHGSKVNKPVDPTRASYKFDGWYKDYTFKNAFSFVTETITTDIMLYAKWSLNSYTVSFETDKGGTIIQDATVEIGARVSKPVDPTRAGYNFVAWYPNREFTGSSFDFDTETITSDIIIYAKWAVRPSINYVIVSGGQSNSVAWDDGSKASSLLPSVYKLDSTNLKIFTRGKTLTDMQVLNDFHQSSRTTYSHISKMADLIGQEPKTINVYSIGIGSGGSGFIGNFEFAPTQERFAYQISHIEDFTKNDVIKSLYPTAEKIITWQHGETDTLNSNINYEKAVLTHLSILRERMGDMSTPVLVGDMPEHWISLQTFKGVQNFMQNVGDRFPYSAFVSSANLPGAVFDNIHFGASQMEELGTRYFNKIDEAKNNANPSAFTAPAAGEYLIARESKGHNLPNKSKWIDRYQEALNFGADNAATFSRLGDLWKYRNADGYKFKYVVTLGSKTATLITTQKYHPFSIRSTAEALATTRSIVSFTNDINAFTANNLRIAAAYYVRLNGSAWLYNDSHKTNFFWGIGARRFSRGVPAMIDKSNKNVVWADKVELYVIVD